MLNQTIDLYGYFGLQRTPGLSGYLNTLIIQSHGEIDAGRLHPAMLIIPGGGYGMVSKREGDPVAIEFLNRNYSCFILSYSVFPNKYPVQLLEAAMAAVYIRENAQKYSVDKNKVCAAGFSAGGHLCGCLATIYNDPNIISALGEERAKAVRPDAVILSYPVISSNPDISHRGSFENVSVGEDCKNYLSLENRITPASSPAFIWHTADDNAVKAENSFAYALSCLKHGVPFELHVFEKGRHGLSTADEKCYAKSNIDTSVTNAHIWIKLAVNWLKSRNLAL